MRWALQLRRENKINTGVYLYQELYMNITLCKSLIEKKSGNNINYTIFYHKYDKGMNKVSS